MEREARFKVTISKEQLADVLGPRHLPSGYADIKPSGVLIQGIRENQRSEWDSAISIEWIFREKDSSA